jgi:hypothetical protein
MLVRQERLHLWLAQHRLEELRRNVAVEQSVTILGEHRSERIE